MGDAGTQGPRTEAEAPGDRWRLVCAVCLYVRTGIAADAVTVVEGYAVCDDHVGYVAQGEQFHSILTAARREG